MNLVKRFTSFSHLSWNERRIYFRSTNYKNEDVTEKEYAAVSQQLSKLPGVNTSMDWDRKYPYGDSLRGIFGDVSTSTEGIPKELTEQYLSKGYSRNDRVGKSYLEYQYEDVLKGTKNKWNIQQINRAKL